ncbi:hypothetical protein PMZ80_011188 [Knufia obscura]|uniref:BZIP domain-containing protein n=1 Tax=Knufia obscura TaxID=1635080 RepID=A0ABR0R8U5_9EURO|nr:hypothetical protein PMZ80_011188 [Knufia obscura]
MREDHATFPQPEFKQERIRNNQRRSRARRQEYLLDLERRIADCQITCRDAEIERAAFLELQIENAKLRELLVLAGVNDQVIEQYLLQSVTQSGHFLQELNPSLRQLKPRIAGRGPARSINDIGQSTDVPATIWPASTGNPMNLSTARLEMSGITTSSLPTSHYIADNDFGTVGGPFAADGTIGKEFTDKGSVGGKAQETAESKSVFDKDSAIGKEFQPEGTIGQIGEAVGGPFSSQGAVGGIVPNTLGSKS